MAVAHLIHGFIGSGKTTYAKKLEKELSALRFSIDEWITQLYGQNPPSDQFDEYHDRASAVIWQVAIRALQLGQDVILDFGFWSRSSRDEARDRIRQVGAQPVLYSVVCSEEAMKARTLARTAQMPGGALHIDKSAFDRLLPKFEPASIDEPHVIVRTDRIAEAVELGED